MESGQCQDAVAAIRRAKTAGRRASTMSSRPRRRQLEVIIKRGLTERAAHLFRRFGHEGPSSKGWGTSMRRRIATLCGATPESSATVARTRSSAPGRSTRMHQDRGLRRSRGRQARCRPQRGTARPSVARSSREGTLRTFLALVLVSHPMEAVHGLPDTEASAAARGAGCNLAIQRKHTGSHEEPRGDTSRGSGKPSISDASVRHGSSWRGGAHDVP